MDTTMGCGGQPVQYVPYYYYPVPAETFHSVQQQSGDPQQYSQYTVVANNNNTSNNNNTNTEQVKSDGTKLSSSSSESSVQNSTSKVIRRRRKKKKITEKSELSPDIDSGYFNGPESSSELTSETELFTDDEIKESVKEKVISDVLIQQCSDPMLDFQFGDVQEILDELSRTKSQDKTEPEEIQQVAETQQEAEEIKTDNKHHNANEIPSKVKHNKSNAKKKSKKKKSTKVT